LRIRINALLAFLWHLILWMWSILILGVVIGVLSNAVYSYTTSGKVNFTDLRTLTIISWLNHHLFQCLLILMVILLFTLCAYLGHLSQERTLKQRQNAHAEALVDIARGVNKALEELSAHTQSEVNLQASSLETCIGNAESKSTDALLWNIPYHRNPFFTGREKLISQLHDQFTSTKTVASIQLQAISGLGGIGKTQTAVEFAYRYGHEYNAILWVNASSRDTLIASFAELASLLDLPEKEEQDQHIMVEAVKRWLLRHEKWLLIVDNAENLELIDGFLPTKSNGHFLMTTRAQALGSFVQTIEVEKMDMYEGVLFLLRRAKLLAQSSDLCEISVINRMKAEAIVEEMGGLPLALDQAGAYIEETRCGVSDYLDRYQQRRLTFLQRRGRSGKEHPEPIAATWSLSFEQVELLNPASADLLRLCAFLAPDAIPEELLIQSANELGPLLYPITATPYLLDEMIGTLLCYSLVERNSDEHTLSIHRLVQAVLKTNMSEEIQRLWAECSVRAVNRAFSEVKVATWSQCQRFLPHAQYCAALIKQWNMVSEVAAQLLNQLGYYIRLRARYLEAEPFCQQALTIREQILGPKHPDTAQSLSNLASLYYRLGKYNEAESLCRRALTIREQILGLEHPDTAQSLNSLGSIYYRQEEYIKAEPLCQKALMIREQVLGSMHPDTAQSLNSLGFLYYCQGKYEQSQALYQRALEIREQVLGPEHPDTAQSLHNLTSLYTYQGEIAQSLQLCLRALAIREKVLGPEHPDTAQSLQKLGFLYKIQGQYKKAISPYQRAMTTFESVLGLEHPYTINTVAGYAELLRKMKRIDEATILEKRIEQEGSSFREIRET
jgi:tetratricopeptide (TPR) repeat protein